MNNEKSVNHVIIRKKDDTYIIYNDKEKRIFKTKKDAMDAVALMMNVGDYLCEVEESEFENTTFDDMLLGYALVPSFMKNYNNELNNK